MTTEEKNLYVEQVRTQSANLLLTVQKMQALKQKWDALDLGNTITDADLGGDNDGIIVSDVSNVIGTTLTALETLLASGHATNLHKIAVV